MQAAVRWGLGLATTGFVASRLIGDSAHRARITGPHLAHAAAPRSDTSTPSIPAGAGVKKLHVYDHCPYCVRVQLVAGWKQIPHEVEVYGYGDFEGPEALTGKKLLPALEYVDNEGETKYMLESLDIVDFIEKIDAGRNSKQTPPAKRDDIQEWVKKVKPTHAALTRPAILKMPIKDWANVEDVTYAVNKYTTRFGFNYTEAQQAKAQHLKEMNARLEELDELLHSEESANPEGRSMDDVLLVPDLRTLSSVKGVQWPARVRAYVDKACADAGIKTYFEHAA